MIRFELQLIFLEHALHMRASHGLKVKLKRTAKDISCYGDTMDGVDW